MADISAQTLEAAIAQGFAEGNDQKVLLSLRQLSSVLPTSSEVFHRLAVVEEQVGEAGRATQAHLKSLQLAPNNPFAYLYTAYWLSCQGREREALDLYSLGSDLAPALLEPSARDDATGLRLNASNRALRQHFSTLHRQTVGDAPELGRIHGAVWTRTHDAPYQLRKAQQKPHLFYIPALTPRHFGDTTQWPWVAKVQGQADVIVEEFTNCLSQVRELGRPYLDKTMSLGEAFKPLLGSLNWTALDLYKDGVCQEDIAKHFPRTLDILQCAPLYGITDQPVEIFFSLLKPGQHITPHFGLSNHSMTVHLPIITPPNCKLIVNNETRQWQPGEIIAFDDSFSHEAINASDEERVVLIFSIWQPELSADEREAITRSFVARSRWLEQRAIPSD